MLFFLDTANIDEIKKYVEWGVVDGVTTNPSLIAKEGVSLEKRIKEILAIVDGPISSEVLSTDAKGMVKEGKEFAAWHENIFVKVPMTAEGLKAVNELSKEGIKTNVTLIFSASQALLAAKAGATLVSPFLGRLDDISHDGLNLIDEIVTIYHNYDIETAVLAASMRHPMHVLECAKMGADICTMPANVMEQMIHHPLTDIGIEKFLADWKNSKAKK